jgi:hypothetical protein
VNTSKIIEKDLNQESDEEEASEEENYSGEELEEVKIIDDTDKVSTEPEVVEVASDALTDKIITAPTGSTVVEIVSNNSTDKLSTASTGSTVVEVSSESNDEVSIAKYTAALKRDPPPGFKDWLRYARTTGCQTDVTAHYPQLYNDYARYFKLGNIPSSTTSFDAAILNSNRAQAAVYEFKDGEFKSIKHKSNDAMLKSIQHLIPKDKTFRIAINNWDEPISLPATDGSTGQYSKAENGIEHNECMNKHAARGNHGYESSVLIF